MEKMMINKVETQGNAGVKVTKKKERSSSKLRELFVTVVAIVSIFFAFVIAYNVGYCDMSLKTGMFSFVLLFACAFATVIL